ncbi:MAG: aldo/keto reductase, partial [Thermoplasmata archaeon]
TADVYDGGYSEIMLGNSIKPYREQVLIATKVRSRMGDGINETGLSRHHMHISLEHSLERLQTKWVDILQYHGWDLAGNIDEFMKTMQAFVDQGKVLYPAISNFAAWQIATVQTKAEEDGYARYESAQMNYSLLNRDVEYEVMPFLKYSTMSMLAWSPLHGGLLTGKYKRGQKPQSGTRMGDRGFFFPYFDEERGWNIVEELENISMEQGSKPSQVALSWIINKGIIAIIGARNMEQLDENLGSIDINLKKEQTDRLDKISEIREMYPNWMIQRQNQDRSFETIS